MPENLENHIRFAPLILETLDSPAEVWLTTHAGKVDQMVFFKSYRIGAQDITHLVSGDAEDEHITSAYALRVGQIDRLRFGTLLYAGYALGID